MSSELVTRLRSLRVLLGIDSPETRGWAPAVQQAARRTIDAAIKALDAEDGRSGDPAQRFTAPGERRWSRALKPMAEELEMVIRAYDGGKAEDYGNACIAFDDKLSAAFDCVTGAPGVPVAPALGVHGQFPKVLDDGVVARAQAMYAEHPTYRGARPLPWGEAPLVVRQEWIDKAKVAPGMAPAQAPSGFGPFTDAQRKDMVPEDKSQPVFWCGNCGARNQIHVGDAAKPPEPQENRDA